ncbi:precorrin-6A synthase (deacetylating) [Streptomyces radicis]|uniref:Precorrin-6A synthase (Deacetylating) n=1 Tax=Streptomyces radicis TaxID=1750517 RepID=A0A3A9VUF1_9ACTN|nr:precorrin-6A synthase (deacetylating) [Streptomyces radicis]RKN04635.1 precorrin-6A synthase (deacetylating) [Streptomyces radicis]RKN15592.1 precorrin-6A synthase (deacetylating) [Streptomyces radicis]
MRIRVLGFGMGPQHVTPEVAEALRGTDYVLAPWKSGQDGLLAVRRAICERYGVELVAVPDPPRDRDDPADYPAAVASWHDARAAAYERVLARRRGTAGFLVWGDPSLYDSTIRVVGRLADRLEAAWDVLPGISAPHLLAARHRIVLHEVGRPVHMTTARRLREAVEGGQDNIVVLLGGGPDLPGLADWRIWWGANLGAPGEELVRGRVGDVMAELAAARARARAAAGWVMDVQLLRRAR